MVAITVDPVEGVACPRADVTVTGLLPGVQVVTVWRATDGEREAVRGARTITVTDSFYIPDFAVPLGRFVSYELEVISGADAGVQGVAADVVVNSDSGFIQDPLDPSSAVPVGTTQSSQSSLFLAGTFAEVTYASAASQFYVEGSSRPVVISGGRRAPSGIPLSLLTSSASDTARMRELVRNSTVLLMRGLPSWGARVPAAATYLTESFIEKNMLPGDDLTAWITTGDVVRPSSARVVVPLWTFGDVMEIHTGTFGDKLAAAGGGTFLDDLKDPAKL